MPTITITDEQKEALDRGEEVTIQPPRKFTLSFFEPGDVRQKWHTSGFQANDERDAAKKWLNSTDGSLPGRNGMKKPFIESEARSARGGMILVAEETARYQMDTIRIHRYEVTHLGTLAV